MTKSGFRSALCSMSFIDASQVPELGTRWPRFRDDPVGYFLRCSDVDSDAIWRECDHGDIARLSGTEAVRSAIAKIRGE